MQRVLVTGATGNVGTAVIRHLKSAKVEVVAGVRDVAPTAGQIANQPGLSFVHFDFENPATFQSSFSDIDIAFLLRPPHLSKVRKVFLPLLGSMRAQGVRKIVFLSVQGVESSRVIPHNQIETAIRDLGFEWIFLRPSYFMQNLTTTLASDIRSRGQIILPAGQAPFNWIDVENVGEVAARLIESFDAYKNQAYELTGLENKNFAMTAAMISEVVGKRISFLNLNPIQFYIRKTREGMPSGMALVMIMLHFLPRFQREPPISNFYEQLTGKKPSSLKKFIERNRNLLGESTEPAT